MVEATRVGTEFLVNTHTEGLQRPSTITGLANGGFVVAWGDSTNSRLQVFDANGLKLGSEITTGFQGNPTITGLANGNFVVSSTNVALGGAGSTGANINAQLFSADGSKVGAAFLVNTQLQGYQHQSQITGLANGGFVVTWIHRRGTFRSRP